MAPLFRSYGAQKILGKSFLNRRGGAACPLHTAAMKYFLQGINTSIEIFICQANELSVQQALDGGLPLVLHA